MKRAGWLFLPGLLLLAGCDFDERLRTDMVTLSRTQQLGNEKELTSNIDFDIGSLEITATDDPGVLYSLDLEYDRASYTPEIHYDSGGSGEAGTFRFDLDSSHMIGIRRDSHENRLRLAFNGSVPVRLKVSAGVGGARLSLSGMKVSEMEFDAGVGGSQISSYEPNPVSCDHIRIRNGVGSVKGTGLGNLNFRQFEFEGGVGGANLDFSGEWRRDAEIRIRVGVGGISVLMPREVGVRLEAQKNFLSGLHLEGFTLRNDHYYSDNYDDTRFKVVMRVDTGVGGFKISWI
ncbi:MAG: hypothetical protein GXX84_12365 [Acidobacteria bacterium]|nr:hypothetical protein [Acidobacteriota bacterium]